MKTFQTIARYLIIFLSLFAITACSYSPETLKSGYNDMGKEYIRELKQMADYSPEQSAKLDILAKDLMQWHRTNMLPNSARLINSLANNLERSQSLSDNELQAYFSLIRSYPNFYESYENNLQLGKLASTLSEKQFIQVQKIIQEDTQDLTEEFQQSSWQKRKRQGVQNLAELMSYLKVDLTNTQLDIARKHINYQRDYGSVLIATTEQWNNTLIDILSKRHEPGFVQKFAKHMQNDNHHKRLIKVIPAEMKHADQKAANMYKELLASLSKEQKATLVNQLKSISKTLNELTIHHVPE